MRSRTNIRRHERDCSRSQSRSSEIVSLSVRTTSRLAINPVRVPSLVVRPPTATTETPRVSLDWEPEIASDDIPACVILRKSTVVQSAGFFPFSSHDYLIKCAQLCTSTTPFSRSSIRRHLQLEASNTRNTSPAMSYEELMRQWNLAVHGCKDVLSTYEVDIEETKITFRHLEGLLRFYFAIPTIAREVDAWLADSSDPIKASSRYNFLASTVDSDAMIFLIVVQADGLDVAPRTSLKSILVSPASVRRTMRLSNQLVLHVASALKVQEGSMVDHFLADYARCRSGLKVYHAGREREVKVQVRIWSFAADILAFDSILEVIGSSGNYPCRLCYIPKLTQSQIAEHPHAILNEHRPRRPQEFESYLSELRAKYPFSRAAFDEISSKHGYKLKAFRDYRSAAPLSADLIKAPRIYSLKDYDCLSECIPDMLHTIVLGVTQHLMTSIQDTVTDAHGQRAMVKYGAMNTESFAERPSNSSAYTCLGSLQGDSTRVMSQLAPMIYTPDACPRFTSHHCQSIRLTCMLTSLFYSHEIDELQILEVLKALTHHNVHGWIQNLTKPKYHYLIHMIRMRAHIHDFATCSCERFEAFNKKLRDAYDRSQKAAPSQEISAKMVEDDMFTLLANQGLITIDDQICTSGSEFATLSTAAIRALGGLQILESRSYPTIKPKDHVVWWLKEAGAWNGYICTSTGTERDSLLLYGITLDSDYCPKMNGVKFTIAEHGIERRFGITGVPTNSQLFDAGRYLCIYDFRIPKAVRDPYVQKLIHGFDSSA